jgi:SAM-dependent methyltransferase
MRGPGTLAVCSPLTRQPGARLLQAISADELAAAWQAHYDLDLRGELGGGREIRLYECAQTGLQFFQPREVAGSADFYAALEEFPWYYLPDKWEHRRALRDLAHAHRVLEVGAGRGEFIARLNTGAGVRAEGIDLNPRAVAEAQRQGLPVTADDVHRLAAERPGQYDAVCAFQVLEHLPDTADFLDALLRLLRPGGRLILSVPNQRSRLADPASPMDRPPHHMTRWHAGVLRALPDWFPLRLEHIVTEPLAPYHVPAYTQRRAAASVWPRRIRKYWWRHLAQPLLRRSATLRALVRGHTLYACFERIGGEQV